MPRVYTHRDLTGCRFGRWEVLSLGEPRIRISDGKKVIRWDCLCECGAKSLVETAKLVHNKSKGCLQCSRWGGHILKTPEQKREDHNKYLVEVWNPANRDKIAESTSKYNAKVYTTDRRYASNLKEKFGITLEDYEVMMYSQNGCCAICGRSESEATERTKRLCVDHDHDTGKIRSLLCHKCNKALGLFRESPQLLQKAVDYLLKYQEETHE